MSARPFAEILESGKFVVTAELNPPKGTHLEPLFTHAERLKDDIDAFNLTDSHSARMSMAPVGAAALLVQRGIEPIMQVTCRDRNRIALQADLLAAHALGVRNVLTMTGDTPAAGDHPDAKGVFDVDGIGLLQAAAALQSGKDLGGQALRGAPDFCVGAVVNPGASDLQKELGRMRDKVAHGARFFQTQAVYDAAAFAAFMDEVRDDKVPILASFIVLRSANMARRMNTVPGISIPESLIQEMEDADDPAWQGIAIAGRIIRELKSLAHGIHLIATGQESRLPDILREAGLASRN
jgi:5,10-methylenetetrahydrofolate reductase